MASSSSFWQTGSVRMKSTDWTRSTSSGAGMSAKRRRFMRSGAYCMRVSRSCSSHSTDIWKSASSDSTGGGSESSRARISSKLSSSTSSTRAALRKMGSWKWGYWGAFRARGRRDSGRRSSLLGTWRSGFNSNNWLSRKGPSAHIPPARPPAGDIRRRRPAPRDPAGPAPSTAAHTALPGASPGSPASYLHRTGLLSTHFTSRSRLATSLLS
ncbi:uncharacterized transmembrane protein DDB_G0289901-like [Phyllostomus discolor]|uniref:Uncharacterized transmembrane protein DDB_G0289901-like n=1 Tax=Phyllostomus discolor TaxID=89673 RepID=A0A7E6CF05_9CHIR|nr:uncharacterized transmembrane protein DDB_G0289901-like [Phyllostomus discolor]